MSLKKGKTPEVTKSHLSKANFSPDLSIFPADTISFVQFTYASTLTTESRIYSRGSCLSVNHFYEAIEISTVTGDYYAFWSSSVMDMYGYIYKNTFNPLNPSMNLLSEDDSTCNNMQFGLTVQLQANTTYVLVATTYQPNKIGNFSIIISGPTKVTLKRIGEYVRSLKPIKASISGLIAKHHIFSSVLF